ncbi:hypothetical protein TRIUR3_27564 [Triticum urartu]|uniref:Uncharacterized protein n=1 Tax=Triticum urartu TaxID=4572 RepID=M7ZKU1_TRIUA|nr:hypothetical protein TRIUR3_27564 [Triticum urartu]
MPPDPLVLDNDGTEEHQELQIRSPEEGCEDLPPPYLWTSSPHRAMPDPQVQHEGQGWQGPTAVAG